VKVIEDALSMLGASVGIPAPGRISLPKTDSVPIDAGNIIGFV